MKKEGWLKKESGLDYTCRLSSPGSSTVEAALGLLVEAESASPVLLLSALLGL